MCPKATKAARRELTGCVRREGNPLWRTSKTLLSKKLEVPPENWSIYHLHCVTRNVTQEVSMSSFFVYKRGQYYYARLKNPLNQSMAPWEVYQL